MHPQKKNMDKAAIFTRALDKSGHQRQITDLKALAKREGYQVEDEDIYSHTGSGMGEKPELNRLMNNIETGTKKYDMVFVQDVARISRLPDKFHHAMEWFTERSIPVYVANIRQPSLNPDGTQNQIFWMVSFMAIEMRQQERDAISRRSASGKEARARQGYYVGGILPYGYHRGEDKKLVIDEQEAAVVKRIYNYALQGLRSQKIAEILNAEGIPTRSSRSVSETTWKDSTIRNILRNPLYKGERIYKGAVVPTPKIIENEVWETVQRKLNKTQNNADEQSNESLPFGYRRDENGKLEINEEEAAQVREIYREAGENDQQQ